MQTSLLFAIYPFRVPVCTEIRDEPYFMSTVYNVYAEVCVGGVWYNLCPYFCTSSGRFQAGEVYSAQSVFSDVYYDLQCYACGWGIPNDMSEDLRAKLERIIVTETPFPDRTADVLCECAKIPQPKNMNSQIAG